MLDCFACMFIYMPGDHRVQKRAPDPLKLMAVSDPDARNQMWVLCKKNKYS